MVERRAGRGCRVALVVLDGWGTAGPSAGNALHTAGTPCVDRLAEGGGALLDASGEAVGLPPSQPGNSQVGHLTLGAGRVVPQDLARIDEAIRAGRLDRGALGEAFRRARQRGRQVHLVGMVSAGGTHSHLRHAVALLEVARGYGLTDATFLHAITDGRDVPARAAETDLPFLERRGANIATVVGRNDAMDRSGRWERTAAVLAAMTQRRGAKAATALAAVRAAYRRGGTDQGVQPTVVGDARIRPGDEVVLFNFRPDGLRQLTRSLHQHGHSCTTMTRYCGDLPIPVAFDVPAIPETAADVVAASGLRQARVAEREKFAHVTYFFDGYREEARAGDRSACVASRTDVASFDRAPAMSAELVTDRTVAALRDGCDFVVTNFANVDTVGHTGRLQAVATAAEVVDRCLRRLIEAARAHGAALVITADHGNAEHMLDDEQTPDTKHTTSPVPCWLVGQERTLRPRGELHDVAPTCLELMGLTVPAAMSGTSLLR